MIIFVGLWYVKNKIPALGYLRQETLDHIWSLPHGLALLTDENTKPRQLDHCWNVGGKDQLVFPQVPCCPPNISSHLFHPLHPHISTSWLTPLRQIGTHPLWSMSPNINPSIPHLLLRPQEGLDTWHHTDVRIVWLSVEVICKYWHISAMKACIRSVVLCWFCFKS